jgi:uncharacterized phage protein (TIGR01671 family)
MNREIKFRAWNPNWDEMVYSTLETVFDKREFYSFGFEVGFSHYPKEGWIIAQYTGLKDKNGKEIYDGDICESIDGIFLVTWNEEKSAFIMVFQDGERLYLEEMWEDTKIIGNINDTPELIKVNNED